MVQFAWSVAQDGYRWCEARPLDAGQLSATSTRMLTPGFTLAWHRYHPLEDAPALYRAFAEVEPTEEGIQAFANHYGMLGLWEAVVLDDKIAQGERLEVWQEHILAMRHTLWVWEALLQRDQATLHRWFTMEDHGSFANVVYRPDTPFPMGVPHVVPQFVDDPQVEAAMLSTPRHGSGGLYIDEPPVPRDVAGLALAWLRAQINTRLAKGCYAYVGYVQERDAAIPLALQTMPRHVCGALWLQLALVVRGTERDQQCRQCGNWFRVPAKARRANTAYCSTRCRVKAARQRQACATPAPRGK